MIVRSLPRTAINVSTCLPAKITRIVLGEAVLSKDNTAFVGFPLFQDKLRETPPRIRAPFIAPDGHA